MKEMNTRLGYEDLLREFPAAQDNTQPQHPVP
jgi:hypothetical protein